MNINSKVVAVFFFVGIAPACAADFPAIESTRISDDFGPRYQGTTIPGKRASSPHPAIDFANPAGISIHSIEASSITSIGFQPRGKGWFMETRSIAEPTRQWRYQHMFSSASTLSTTAGSGLFRVFPSTAAGGATIVFYLDISRKVPLKAFTANPNPPATFNVPIIPGTHTLTVPLVNLLAADERFAPVGRSGSADGTHLHLTLTVAEKIRNPFLYLSHPASNFKIESIDPQPGFVFTAADLPGGVFPRPIKFDVNSTEGLDLNRVEVSVIDPNGAETILGGYDYQGALSSTSYSAALQVRPISKPPGKDQFLLPGARLRTSSAPAGGYRLRIRAFNILGVSTEKLVPFTINDPIQGASIRIDSNTSTANYDSASGGFFAQVHYTATSASGIRAHQLYTLDPNSSFGQISQMRDISPGLADGLPSGDYAIVVIDNADIATRLDFSLSTKSESLSSYLAGMYSTGTYEHSSVVIATAAGQLPRSDIDVEGYIDVESANSSLIAASPFSSGEIFYPPGASFSPPPGLAILGVAVTSVTAVTHNVGDPARSLAYNSRIIFAGTSGIQEAGIPGFRYSNSHYETTAPDNTQLSGEELTLFLGGAQIASYKYTRGGMEFTGLEEDDNNPLVVLNAAGPISLPRSFEAKLLFKPNAASLCRPVDGTNFLCFNAGVASPIVSVENPFDVFGVTLESSMLTVLGSTRTFNIIDRDVSKSNVALTFGTNVGIARLTVEPFSSSLTSPNRLEAPGPGGVSLSLADVADTASFNQSFTLSLPFVASELEPGQVGKLRVLRMIGGQSSILTPTVNGNTASVNSASTNPGDLGSYELVVVDEIPPGAINIALSEANADGLGFSWTATGDDGATGEAAGYDIRFGLCPGGTLNFDYMASLGADGEDNDFVPGMSGEEQGVLVGGLNPDTEYCLGVMVFDLAGNAVGPYVVAARTLPSPSTIQSDDLIATQPELTFEHQSPVPLEFSKLSATSPEWIQYKEAVANKFGIQPISNIFNIGPSGTTFGQDAQLVVRYDTGSLNGIAPDSLTLYESVDNPTIAFPLPDQIHDQQNHLIVAPVRSLNSKFAIFGATTAIAASDDVAPPRTSIIIPSAISSGINTVHVSSSSLIGFFTFDDKLVLNDGLGIGSTQTFYSTDGGLYVLFSSSFGLSMEGPHEISFFSIDLVGNVELPIQQSIFVDMTPPITQFAQMQAEISLSAFDPNSTGGASGVARIRYLVDFANPDVCNGVVEDTSAAPGTCENPWYVGPFALSNGSHMIAFQAFDRVGNAEAMQFAYPFVGSGPSSPSAGGMGIGRDPNDALWTVVSENEALSFARLSSTGALLSSATLQNAVFGFPWSVFFDAAGRSYAIGIAEANATQAVDVGVYKASPAGDAVESRTLFDSGYSNNDIVLDAKAPGWIVGAAQTSGPVDFDADGERTFSMALWKFDPILASIQLSTTYARASFDVGAGVAVDVDGSLWISGYSLQPDAPATFGFDLSLWHYAADGHTLLAEPLRWPGYLSDFDGANARVHVTSGAVYIASPRANAAGRTDTAFLRIDKATGRTTTEKVWRAGDGSMAYPVAILPEASGFLIAGAIGDTETEAALWRFGYDGSFQSATTADAGGAEGAVFKGNELWLSVDGSTVPYRVLAETPVSGLLIDISTPSAQILVSISVTPSTASILRGETAQFMAAGTFTDASTRDLTGEVDWSTDIATVAAVSAAGLATGLGGGTAHVIASLGAISGQSELTVSMPAPTVISISPVVGGNDGPLAVVVNGSGFGEGAGLALNRVLGSSAGFTTSGALAYRGDPTAVRLMNGKVLIAGGRSDFNQVFSSVEIFDPNLGSWSVTGAMATPRYGHTMTLLPDGKVLVAGGMACDNCGSTPLKTAELYDPDTGTWSYTGLLASARATHTATLLASGKVLVTGGSGTDVNILSSAELYNPTTKTWASAGLMSSGAHFRHSAAKLPDGRVLVAGGQNASFQPTATADIYNPGSNTWSPAAPLLTPRRSYTLNPLPNGKLLAAGGAAGVTLAASEIYDSGTGAWTPAAPLNSKRAYHATVRLSDGTLLVIGGYDGGVLPSPAEAYDPVANSWSTVGSLQRFAHTATLLADGRVLVAGGTTPQFLSVTSIYSPASLNIIASSLTYMAGNMIGGVLDLAGQPTGLWDVIVTNLNQPSARLVGAFTIHGTAPPTAVGNLAISTLGTTTADFTWTAPGGQGGTVASYDLRRATFPITPSNFVAATPTPAPVPTAPGSLQAASVDLGSDSSLFVALRSVDIYGYASSISNVASLSRSTTLINGTPEATIWATQPVFIEKSSSGAAASAAAAQGLIPVSSIYDPNPKSIVFNSGANAAFVYDAATLAAQGVPASSLRIYQLIGGALVAFSSQTLSGQTVAASTLSFAGALGLFGAIPAPTLASIAPTLGGNGGHLAVTVNGSGIVAGAQLALNRLMGSAAGFATSGALAMRDAATAVRLTNGKVLIAGGRGSVSNIIFASAEVFDPALGSWSPTGAMSTPRLGHTMTLLADGKVLVAGGTSCGNCGIALNTAELYDPVSGTWSNTGPLTSVRVEHTATLLPSGNVLVAGGGTVNNGDLIKSSAELYNPATKVWTVAGTMPSGAHFAHSAAMLPDGRVLVAGGRNSSALLTAAVDIYNPGSNTWSPASQMSKTRSVYTLNPLPGGKLLAAGGDDGTILAESEIYNPENGTWSAGAPLNARRAHHTSARLSDGTILVMGGAASSVFPSAVEAYDPVANSWSTVGSLQRLGHTSTMLTNGSVLVAGGFNAQGVPETSIYLPASLSIIASNLSYTDGNAIGGTLDLTGQSVGLWDVVVTNPNRLSARLSSAFTIHGAAPPSAVADLALSTIGLSTVTLQWTVPASPSGALISYEIRYASVPLDSGNFASGTSVIGPAPMSVGTVQSASIGGLDGVAAFYAALKSRDVYGNVSTLSNVASWARGTAAVGDQPEFTFSANVAVTVVPVSTYTAPGIVVLATSTAQGLTLVSAIYDLGPEGAVFNPYARMTFVYSTATLASLGLLPGDIRIYQYVSGAGMVEVSSQTTDMAANTITGYVPSLSSIFAVFGVVKDRTSPVTSLSVGPSATFTGDSGDLYASPGAGFGFRAEDPVVFGTASGVERTNYRVDGSSTAAFSSYTSTFALTEEGRRTLWFYSADRAGNVEVVRSSGINIDATAPVTTLQVIGSSVAGASGSLVVSSTTVFVLSASDLASNGVASGVGNIFYGVDAAAASQYAEPFGLFPGSHSISYFSKDNVANAETPNVLSVMVDAVAPQSVLLVAGAAAAGPVVVLISTDSVGLSASDSAAGVAEILFSLDGAAEQVYTSTFSPSVGSHTLSYRGVDRLGNAEIAHQVSISVLLYDVTPPSASLSLVDQSTIATNSPVIVATYGDGGRGVDMSSVRLTLDGVDVTAQSSVFDSSTTFSPLLSQGAHDLLITFADFAGNHASAAASFFVDSMPPATILLVDGVAVSTTALVIVSTNSFGFASTDAGAGVAQIVYSVDGDAPAVYNSTFSLAAGDHSLAYQGIDKAGNVEPTDIVAITVLLYDAAPPSLVLTPATGSTVATATPRITADYSDAGRGVDASTVRLSLDGLDVTSIAIVSASSAVFIPSTALSQAAHTVVLRVGDLAGNQSIAASTFLVDSLPPETALLVDGHVTDATSLVLISTNSMGFSATDAGAGVFQTRYSLDGSLPESVYVSTFGLTAGEHSLTYRSFDLAGIAEAAKTVSVSVFGFDVTPPTLALIPSNGSTVTVAAPLIAALYGDLGRGIDGSSVRLFLDGVDATAQADVTTSSAVVNPGADLSQGAHTVTAEVADFAGNRSSTTAIFLLDSIAPVTTLLVDGFAALATEFVLVSTDSVGFSVLDSGVGTAETRYAMDGSTSEVVFAAPFKLSAGVHALAFHSRDFAGNVEAARTVSITVLAEDTLPPLLTVAPADGSTVTLTTPAIMASYSDLGRGVDLASVHVSLDGQEVTSSASVGASSATFIPAAALSQGTHTVTAVVSDLAGNASSARATFRIDSLPPLTALLVNGYPAGGTTIVLASTDAVSFAAADSGVGVLETRYSVDGASEAVFTAAFFLSPGSLSLAFHSGDRAGNWETMQTVSVVVTTPFSDTTPPLVHLDLPGPSALGVEQALGGIVSVRGGATDTSVLAWTLESAPGASAAGGFTPIASGAGNLSGLIAAWNTNSLSGYQSVRLRATDAFGNAASATATVFVGSPVFSFAVGRKDSNVIVNTIKGPTGIAVRSDGAIWVASTENDTILLVSPEGLLLGEAGQAPGQSGADNKKGKGVDTIAALGFKSPQGLATDAADFLYVADRDLDRVVKLSRDGHVLLLQLGKTDGQGRSKPGSGPGELRHPFDVAVDVNGDIYVADSGNQRIQVFNAAGSFLRQFGQGVMLSTSEVRGITLTSVGLWVSDRESERIYLFSRAGALLKSIGDADSVLGEVSRTRGLASDRLGALYVVEPNRDRAQKFDPSGRGLIAFGSKAGLNPADKNAKRYLTQPVNAAVAPDGSLWITDAGRDRIVRYALPAAGYGAAAYAAGGGAVSSSSVEPARRVVDHKDGAKVERDDGAGVDVPKGALAEDLEITVDKGDENVDKEEKTAKRREKKITAASEEVQYGPEGTSFTAPVTLALPYDANLVAAQGIREDELKVYYWNPTLKDWQAMPSTVDKRNKTVYAQTTHFSAYQVGGSGGVGVAAIDDFGLRDGYAFPNPSRNGAAVTFRMQAGSVDSIEVRVYDLSGRKIHSSSDFLFLGPFDDGNGKGNQNTYDHVWSISGIGSGVYTYVMTAKKAGQSDIRKMGKVGVIK